MSVPWQQNPDWLSTGAVHIQYGTSPDGTHLYVGNFLDSDLWVLKVEGGKLVDTGKRLKLPGHPASLRGSVG